MPKDLKNDKDMKKKDQERRQAESDTEMDEHKNYNSSFNIYSTSTV